MFLLVGASSHLFVFPANVFRTKAQFNAFLKFLKFLIGFVYSLVGRDRYTCHRADINFQGSFFLYAN